MNTLDKVFTCLASLSDLELKNVLGILKANLQSRSGWRISKRLVRRSLRNRKIQIENLLRNDKIPTNLRVS